MRASTIDSLQIRADLEAWVLAQVQGQKGHDDAVKPDHYRPWHWPLHPVSFDFHIPASEWHGATEFEFEGEKFPVAVARTPWGVFGRCEALRAEAKGDSIEAMLKDLGKTCRPLFERQNQLGELLGMTTRYRGSIRELSALDKLKLFYASDRAIAHDAQTELETSGNLKSYGPALISILFEAKHKNRRTAQWLVLDLFEDLSSYCASPEIEREAVNAIKALMWNAQDDFARAIYKAGVVLGGHVCTEHSADTIIELMSAPSRIARRSAMHASFHLCEWLPSRRPQVLATLANASAYDPEPLLRAYCSGLAKDIEREVIEHIAEPIFPDEP